MAKVEGIVVKSSIYNNKTRAQKIKTASILRFYPARSPWGSIMINFLSFIIQIWSGEV